MLLSSWCQTMIMTSMTHALRYWWSSLWCQWWSIHNINDYDINHTPIIPAQIWDPQGWSSLWCQRWSKHNINDHWSWHQWSWHQWHPLLRYGILNPTAVRAAATSGKPGVKVFNHDYDDVGSDVDDNGDEDDDGDEDGDERLTSYLFKEILHQNFSIA